LLDSKIFHYLALQKNIHVTPSASEAGSMEFSASSGKIQEHGGALNGAGVTRGLSPGLPTPK
jgi:hypothetical protein